MDTNIDENSKIVGRRKLVATDKLNALGPALARVGEDVYSSIGGRPDGIYLYVEIGDGWVGPSLFQDEGNRVVYYSGSDELADLLMEAWYLEPADKRWTAMHYMIENGNFDATFEFDDLDGSGESISDRRERILRARYGDKPVVYPPLPGDTMDLNRAH